MKLKEFEKTIFVLKDKLYRFANSILYNTADAEDIVQEVLTKMWCNKNKLQGIDNKEAYVMRTTKNMCLDKLRHNKMILQKNKDLTTLNTVIYEDKTNENKETNQFLRKIINNLPEKQKMIIHLRDIEGYDFNEIATMLDMNISAIRTNLSRARQKVKEEMITLISISN